MHACHEPWWPQVPGSSAGPNLEALEDVCQVFVRELVPHLAQLGAQGVAPAVLACNLTAVSSRGCYITASTKGPGSMDDVVQPGPALHSCCLTASFQHHHMADGAETPWSCQAGTDSMPSEAAPSNCTWLHQPQGETYKETMTSDRAYQGQGLPRLHA